MTKVFTATTLMQLVQEKKLKLEDTLTTWMMNTERLTASAKASHRAIGYSLADNGELKRGLYDPSGTAAGSFLSTIGDLAKLDAALYVDSVLTQKTRDQMSQPARLNRGIVNWYGMGWFLDEYKNHRM